MKNITFNGRAPCYCSNYALLLTALLVLCVSVHTFPVLPSRISKRLSSINSRQLCRRTNETCQFYSHCIESLFPCGSTGLALAYAEKRCNSIRLFRSSSDGCDSCLESEEIVQWTLGQERCFQQGMYDVLTGQEFQNKTADPVTCLLLERRALDMLETCSRPELCTAIDQPTDIQTLTGDLSKVVEAFRVNEYYSSKAERALHSSVLDCNVSQIDALALTESLISEPPQLRVVFCATVTASDRKGRTITDIAELQSIVRRKAAAQLGRPLEQFVPSGLDPDSRCTAEHPEFLPPLNGNSSYHFVTWFPLANDSLPYNLSRSYTDSNINEVVALFEFESTNSSCGNGLREASEVCDLGVLNGAEGSGCTGSCLPAEYFDCSVEANQPSVCWCQVCGDGRRTSGEECDDGSTADGITADGDGCSSMCRIEPKYHCSTRYNRTSQCEEIPPSLEPTPSPSVLPPTPTPTSYKLEHPPTPSQEAPPTTPSQSATPPLGGVSSQSRTAGTSPSLTAALALLAVIFTRVHR